LGNGRSVVQATGAAQPAVVANIINGLQVVRFDGVDDLLTRTWNDVQLDGGLTLFIVAAVRFANDTLYRPLLRFEPSNVVGIQHEASNDPTSPSKLEAFAFGNSVLYRATPSGTTAAGPRLMTVIVDPTASGVITLWKNGAVNGGPTTGPAGLTSTLLDTLRLGADATGSNFGQYDIGEFAVFDRVMTTADRQASESYLMSRWGLP
jgi:hypothetical protein